MLRSFRVTQVMAFLFFHSLLTAEVEVAPKLVKPATEVKEFHIKRVIAPVVDKLAVPDFLPGSVGVEMTVSSPSEKAREHVKQGFALVHAHWDFEAYRHFCAAIKEDKECLLAYCGVSLALAQPFHEFSEYRRAAVERMLDLMEVDTIAADAGKLERYPKVEKQFAAATATMLSSNAGDAGNIFIGLGQKFPNLHQARLMGIYLTRGGYDLNGEATPAQVQAIEKTRKILEEHPGNPLVVNFWMSLCAEAPSSVVNLKKDVLPYARTLVEKCPNMPPWWHAIGHMEWRAGNYLLAEQAFAKAAELYEQWMKKSGIGVNDCPGLVKTKCYLANTLFHRGDFAEAIKVAKQVRAMKVDIKRPKSSGNQILLWRGYTLAARLYIAHGAQGDMDRGLASLPTAAELKPIAEHKQSPTLAGSYINALRVYMGARKAVEAKDLIAASSLHRDTFRKYITSLGKVFEGAQRGSDASQYLHAGKSLSIYDRELKGLIRMNSEVQIRPAAVGDFYSARDLQYTPTLMTPPMVLMPMENRLGEYYLVMGKNTEAYESFIQGHQRYPNNMGSLVGMKRSLELLEKSDEAKLIQQHIDLVKPKE